MEIQGKITEIFDPQEISDTFKKREFVIETEEQYPNILKFETSNNGMRQIDSKKIGDVVVVHLNIRGRTWQKSPTSDIVYFTSLHAWRIELVSTEANTNDFPTDKKESAPDDMADDLPF